MASSSGNISWCGDAETDPYTEGQGWGNGLEKFHWGHGQGVDYRESSQDLRGFGVWSQGTAWLWANQWTSSIDVESQRVTGRCARAYARS